MPEISTHEPGTFSWIDLQTTNVAGAKAFYGELFGWQLQDMPAGDAGTYTMAKLQHRDVCGLSQQNDMMREQGVPPVWTAYVTVTSADQTANKARELGGKVVAPPFDVMDAGRMAVLQDPSGATFAIWQPKTHAGAGVLREPGTLSWVELATPDTEAPKRFYAGLFGWQPDTKGEGANAYTEWARGEGQPHAGGMLQITSEWGPHWQSIPPHWMVYFAVASVDDTAGRAKSLAGKVLVGPKDIPKVGRFAVLQDPQGATFSIIKLEHHA
ncbi:MAG TPA: VOC family protein [Polyangiaceae bacterium]|nr:VOC family protein [Polyangiaceae bacterium]